MWGRLPKDCVTPITSHARWQRRGVRSSCSSSLASSPLPNAKRPLAGFDAGALGHSAFAAGRFAAARKSGASIWKMKDLGRYKSFDTLLENFQLSELSREAPTAPPLVRHVW
jgi:hypothetical protein